MGNRQLSKEMKDVEDSQNDASVKKDQLKEVLHKYYTGDIQSAEEVLAAQNPDVEFEDSESEQLNLRGSEMVRVGLCDSNEESRRLEEGKAN